jgi:hypothetical protein
MTKRMDILEHSGRDRHRHDTLSEATEQAPQLSPGVIDPDAAESSATPRERGEQPYEFIEEDQETPTGKPPLSYGRVPLSFMRGAPKDDATGDLPEGVERHSLPDPGEYAIRDATQLAHPILQTPAGIGGN